VAASSACFLIAMLLDLTLDYTDRRPFVCDGRPEDSAVLIVGLTPGTSMKPDWRDWWDGERFNKAAFMAAYRDAKGLRPGQSLLGARLRMEHLALNGIACVETNLWSREQPSGHPKGKPDNLAMVRDLIAAMPRLRVAVMHGKVQHGPRPRPHVAAFVKPLLPDGVEPLKLPHLSRVGCDALLDKVRAALRP
jgi:hypothetical protein